MATIPDLVVVAGLQAQLESINARIASGVRDVRYNNRSTTFDLGVLQTERLRIEALLRASTPSTSVPTLRRILVTQRTKGL